MILKKSPVINSPIIHTFFLIRKPMELRRKIKIIKQIILSLEKVVLVGKALRKVYHQKIVIMKLCGS